jgi:Protein of unknown function (DUF4236)
VIQFRKAFKLGPARFTLTKRGVSRSIGFGPLRYRLGAVACAGPGGYRALA